jgi:dipeptidyl aminopeptidase/acylaminoacyl peptidase
MHSAILRRVLIGVAWTPLLAALSVVHAPRFVAAQTVQTNDGNNLPKYVPSADELRASYQRAQAGGPAARVYKMQLTPHWFHGDTRFWYRNDLRGGTREFIVVDAEKGTRQPAFDHEKLAANLSKAAAASYVAEKLPFDAIDFADDDKAIRFKVAGTNWKCDLASYACSKIEEKSKEQQPESKESAFSSNRDADTERLESPWPDGLNPDAEQAPQQRAQPQGERPQPRERSPRSPDDKWNAFIKDANVFVRARDGKETQLTHDGKPGRAYGQLQWSPDSKSLVAFRIEPGDDKEVYLIESSPKGGGRAKLHTRPYPLPGDKFAAYELHLFDVAGQKEIKTDVEKIDFGFPRLRWNKDGRRFTYQKTDRGHQRFRVIEIDAASGKSRNLIDEKSDTFIWTAHAENLGANLVSFVNDDEIVYLSERDGWRHMYLVDAKEGKIKNRITEGKYVIRAIEKIDAERRQIWFRANGKNPEQDPYFVHAYRVNFDGSGLVALTEGDGGHTVQFSPDRKYLIDAYSRVDIAPTHELRRASDGTRVCELEKADVSELSASGWQPPEVFVAKGRDGATDIWGIISRPQHFDPKKKYPVIESIYAGPQGSFVPKTFSPARRFAALTELGFIVVQIDGMGTANRSKAFHDVCWHNLKDAGFPDRILWHQAAAKKYPYYDITRVGIYGTSAGGQNATGGVLFHPDFYKTAVSACGCHDNRMDKASWNEQWMGYPVGPHYAECSNIDNAHRLRGKLLLIVGEMDTNVPPESTFRLVDALVKAGKDFEFVVVPGMGHSDGGSYGRRRMQDFFVRHLHGVAPPERNGAG